MYGNKEAHFPKFTLGTILIVVKMIYLTDNQRKVDHGVCITDLFNIIAQPFFVIIRGKQKAYSSEVFGSNNALLFPIHILLGSFKLFRTL